MKKQIPKTDLGFERGSPFVMAWVYLPTGPHLYTGSLGKIRYHLKDGPICHGFIRYFAGGLHSTRRACLFGKWSYTNYRTNKIYCSLHHCSLHELRNTGLFSYLRPFLHPKRKLWVLTANHKDQTILLGRWRKLPSTYLKALGDFESGEFLRQQVFAATQESETQTLWGVKL